MFTVFKQKSDSVVYQTHSVHGYNHLVCFDNHAIYYVPYYLLLYSHICFMLTMSSILSGNFSEKMGGM